MSQTLEIQELQCPYFQENVEDGEEEEALSLCDLPVTATSEREGETKDEVENQTGNDSDFDFDFGSLMGSRTALESDMCAADEIFSGGQMLPFRHSVSSESSRAPVQNLSRSDYNDRTTGLGPSRSSSSRSSSTRSQQSGTSSISTGSSSSTGLGLGKPLPKPKPGNHFHAHPSPNPQIRASGARPVNPKSTMWQVLRLGLVRTPEIELQDLRVRSRTSSNKNIPISRNNSISSSSSSDECNKIGDLLVERRKRRNQISSNVSKGGMFGSCKCSIGAIEPILMPPPPRVNKSNYYFGGKSGISSQNSNKLLLNHQLMLFNEDKVSTQQQQRRRRQRQQQHPQHQQPEKSGKGEVRHRKPVVSHHRTFEWLRDISQTSVLNS